MSIYFVLEAAPPHLVVGRRVHATDARTLAVAMAQREGVTYYVAELIGEAGVSKVEWQSHERQRRDSID